MRSSLSTTLVLAALASFVGFATAQDNNNISPGNLVIGFLHKADTAFLDATTSSYNLTTADQRDALIDTYDTITTAAQNFSSVLNITQSFVLAVQYAIEEANHGAAVQHATFLAQLTRDPGIFTKDEAARLCNINFAWIALIQKFGAPMEQYSPKSYILIADDLCDLAARLKSTSETLDGGEVNGNWTPDICTQ